MAELNSWFQVAVEDLEKRLDKFDRDALGLYPCGDVMHVIEHDVEAIRRIASAVCDADEVVYMGTILNEPELRKLLKQEMMRKWLGDCLDKVNHAVHGLLHEGHNDENQTAEKDAA